ncbi:amidohydrolase family protein (plasmid) [Rhizobium beringeri]|nr:amidohydrolase family protein [Rhizobium beringeri]
MAIDLVIRNAFLPGLDGFTDIAFANGRIAAMAPHFVCDAPEYDARGRLISGGLIETHIHLDKAGIIGRCVLCTGTLGEAVSETSKAKAAFTEEDVYARSAGIVEQAILNGTNRLRTFVEVDGRAGFRSFDAIKRLRADYAAAIDIEICAFAQEGLTNDPGTEEMLDTALASGADLVGGCPYTDPNPDDHIRRIFDLGERYGVPVDFHLDFDLDPAGSNLPLVITETLARGYQGRVSVGHVTKLSALPPEAFEAVGRSLDASRHRGNRAAGNGSVSDGAGGNPSCSARRYAGASAGGTRRPHDDLDQQRPQPVHPFGDVSLIRMANLYANVAQIGTAEALEAVFDMITINAARLLGLEQYALDVGGPATLVLFDAVSGADAVARLSPQ